MQEKISLNEIKPCSLRHPKMCIRIIIEGLCYFEEKSAYKHKQISPFHDGSQETVCEDPKTLKWRSKWFERYHKNTNGKRGEEELNKKKSMEEIKKNRNKNLGHFI